MHTLLAFSADQVSRVAGVSERQLRYWDSTGLFPPEYGADNRRSPNSRVYSYRDLVGLRTLAHLRNQHRVPLQALREVDRWLAAHYDTPWSQLTFWVAGKRVYFEDPESGARVAARPRGQTAMPIQMRKIEREVAERVKTLQQRRKEDIGRIERNRHVQRNAWVIAGTRVPTWSIWEFYEAGYDQAALLRQFPDLTPADIEAALHHEESLKAQARAG